jgi:phage head maturation protease
MTGPVHLTGYASVFDGYTEVVRSKAFTQTLASDPQVHLYASF